MKRPILRSFFIFLLLGTLYCTLVYGSAPPRTPFIQISENLWYGTNQGLFRYQSENDEVSVVKTAEVTDLCYDDNVLWAGSRQGLFYADVRYLDWKEVDLTGGSAPDTIVRITADLDYVYVAHSRGLSRFSKLIEQWETLGDFSSVTLYDLYSDQDYLWVGTSKGIHRFNKQYERWETFTSSNGLSGDHAYRIFLFNTYIWVLTEHGFSRFSYSMKTWSSFGEKDGIIGTDINDIQADPAALWVISGDQVHRYVAQTQSWEYFSRNQPIENHVVYAMATAGNKVWFCTDDGVQSYDEQQRVWSLYTAIDGLSDDIQEWIVAAGQTVICKKDDIFSFYKPTEDLWETKTLNITATDAAERKWDFFNNDQGIGLKTPKGKSVSVLGRAYLKAKNKAQFPTPVLKSIADYIMNKNLDSLVAVDTVINTNNDTLILFDTVPRFKDFLFGWAKADMNLSADMGNDRSIRAAFNNTDPLYDIRWAAQYRGNSGDNIRKAGYMTDQKSDYFFSTLIDPTYYEGGAVRTEFGDRIGEKKRRRVNSGMWGGWRKTKYFRSRIPFQEDNYYTLGISNVITESVELRVDGKIIDPREYSIERTMGLLTFKNENLVNPDSDIDIALEYEPKPDTHTAQMLGAENVIVFSDQVAIGANGIYQGVAMPDVSNTGTTRSRLVAGAVNSSIDLKSSDGGLMLKAVPEIAVSYNDSVLVEKRGTGAKIDFSAAAYRLTVKGNARLFTPYYENCADLSSIYGRINHQEEAQATFDITSFMPLTAGMGYTDAQRGNENRQYISYLLSPAARPSLKIQGLHQNSNIMTIRDAGDSLQSERWNGKIETEWEIPASILDALHFNRIWFNASYDINFITQDSTYDTLSIDSTDTQTVECTLYSENCNHNLFGAIRIAPVKSLSIQARPVYRLFQKRTASTAVWEKSATRFLPHVTLFSQEFIPGITVYGKYEYERINGYYGTDILDTVGTMKKNAINSSVQLYPGIWWSLLNPLQVIFSYNLGTTDSSITADTLNLTDTSIVSRDTVIAQTSGHTITANPILTPTQDIRLSHKTEIGQQKHSGAIVNEHIKFSNDGEFLFRERKTKIQCAYDYTKTDAYNDTATTDAINDIRVKWTERWLPHFRTEIPVPLSWQKSEAVYIDTLDSLKKTITTSAWSISPAILFDWKISRTIIREFHIQYQTGFTLNYDLPLLKTKDYTQSAMSWDNRIDLGCKIMRNIFLRLLISANYTIEDTFNPAVGKLERKRFLEYDAAELKATAIF